MIGISTRSNGDGCTIMAACAPANAPCSSRMILPPPPSSAGVPSTVTSTPMSSATAASASYSAHTTTRNGPGPLRAEKAVSRPPTPRSTANPAALSASDSHAQACSSSMPSSGSAWMRWLRSSNCCFAPSIRSRAAALASAICSSWSSPAPPAASSPIYSNGSARPVAGVVHSPPRDRHEDRAVLVVAGDQRAPTTAPPPPEPDVGADVGVGQVLEPLAGTAPQAVQPAEPVLQQPVRPQSQRRGGGLQAGQHRVQLLQPGNPVRERSLLVAQGSLQPCQLDKGGMGEDLDRPPAVAAAGIARNRLVGHRQALHQLHRAHPPVEQGEVAGVGPGAELAIPALQLGLAAPPASCAETNSAISPSPTSTSSATTLPSSSSTARPDGFFPPQARSTPMNRMPPVSLRDCRNDLFTAVSPARNNPYGRLGTGFAQGKGVARDADAGGEADWDRRPAGARQRLRGPDRADRRLLYGVSRLLPGRPGRALAPGAGHRLPPLARAAVGDRTRRQGRGQRRPAPAARAGPTCGPTPASCRPTSSTHSSATSARAVSGSART